MPILNYVNGRIELSDGIYKTVKLTGKNSEVSDHSLRSILIMVSHAENSKKCCGHTRLHAAYTYMEGLVNVPYTQMNALAVAPGH